MKRILIFGGTTEGRELAEFCERRGIPADVSVATEYGREVLREFRHVRILMGRRTEPEMEALFRSGAYALVLDATHPYAAEVTASVREAGARTGLRVCRVLREARPAGTVLQTGLTEETVPVFTESAEQAAPLFAESAEQAAEFLAGTEGNILLTTGSKDLHKYGSIPRERLFVRVLPGEEPLRLCREAGILTSHIAAVQGPFSAEMNTALLRHFHCAFLVTKESGRQGGFAEKLRAAAELGVRPVIIGRPPEAQGISEAEAEKLLKELAAAEQSFAVTICGIGPGSAECMTGEVTEAIRRADLLIGASRMVEAAEQVRRSAGLPEAAHLVCWSAETIAAGIREAEAADPGGRAAVLMSGDSGFYSGTAGVLKVLEQEEETTGRHRQLRICPGISSLSMLSARAGIPWDQVTSLSLHGRRMNVLSELRRTGAAFLTLENTRQLDGIARALTAQGLGACEMICGEDLSRGTETVRRLTAEAWAREAAEREAERQEIRAAETDRQETGRCASETIRKPEDAGKGTQKDAAQGGGKKQYMLSAALLLAPAGPLTPLHPGIPDACFRRGKVPLTKAPVRAQVMAELKPARNSVCWDIGSGTGGMTAELSMAAPTGTVYAVECAEEAFSLTAENTALLGLLNVVQIRGKAPEALAELPAPDRVFVGGSSGNLRQILAAVYEKNPAAVTAVTAVTLETAAELSGLLKEYEAAGHETEVLQVSAAAARRLGAYHLMTAQNPVWIAVIRGRESGR